ncbi:MAG: hypothetical protein ABIT37_05805, partial [Luteolibacter sp.]
MTQPDFAARLAPLVKGDREVVLDHSAEAAHGFLAAVVTEAAKDRKKTRVWMISEMPRHRERLAAELELWGVTALVLPEGPVETGDGTIADPESAAEWFSVLEILARSETCVVICGTDAFSGKAPSPGALRASRTPLKPGTTLDPGKLAQSLTDHGYERVPTVASRGQFAVRGGILDLFAWQAAKPLRLEFFDTDLESVREFDLDSQASTKKLLESDLLLAEPSTEGTVADYRRKNDLIISFGAEIEKPDVRILEDAAEYNSEEDFSLACFGSPLGTFEAGDFVLEESR